MSDVAIEVQSIFGQVFVDDIKEPNDLCKDTDISAYEELNDDEDDEDDEDDVDEENGEPGSNDSDIEEENEESEATNKKKKCCTN